MTDDRQRKLQRLFGIAKAIPAASRAAFLEESCGDDSELRREEEDRIDNAAADAALAEPGESIPRDVLKAELGLQRGALPDRMASRCSAPVPQAPESRGGKTILPRRFARGEPAS